MTFVQIVDDVGKWVDAAGVVVVVVGVIGQPSLRLLMPDDTDQTRIAGSGNNWAGPSCWAWNYWSPPTSSRLWPPHRHWRASLCCRASY